MKVISETCGTHLTRYLHVHYYAVYNLRCSISKRQIHTFTIHIPSTFNLLRKQIYTFEIIYRQNRKREIINAENEVKCGLCIYYYQ